MRCSPHAPAWGRIMQHDNETPALVVLSRDDTEAAIDGARKVGGSPGRGAAVPSYQFTDAGNAERFARTHGRSCRYSEATEWLVYDGKRWARDQRRRVMRLAKETAVAMLNDAAGIPDSKERDAAIDWARRCLSEPKLRAMVSLSRSEPGVSILPAELDADPWVLNCSNGTLDLRSMELRPHRREDLVSKLAPVAFDPGATCSTWEHFLHVVMGGNETLIAFLQRAVGYALTGDTREHALFLLYGTGRNGKSTFLGALADVLGDYARKAEAETFLASDRGANGPREDLARLAGARLVTAIEVDQGRRLAEAMVKEATGGDRVTARFLFRDSFEFLPQFKLFLAANHKPVIRGTDDGIWRRIRLIPFEVQIPEDQIDRVLPEKLRAEAAGILAWAVRGCAAWQESGLGCPSEVLDATATYRNEQDPLADFLATRCMIGPGYEIEAGRLFAAYEAWCSAEGEKPLPRRTFGTRLTERGVNPGRKPSGQRTRQGIDLAPECDCAASTDSTGSDVSFQQDSTFPTRSEEVLGNCVESVGHVETRETDPTLDGLPPAVAEYLALKAAGAAATGQPPMEVRQ